MEAIKKAVPEFRVVKKAAFTERLENSNVFQCQFTKYVSTYICGMWIVEDERENSNLNINAK